MRERPLTTYAVTGLSNMNKYKKLLPLRIISIVFAAIILFFVIKNGTAFEAAVKNSFAMFFSAEHPFTDFISCRLFNAMLLIAMLTVIVFNVLSHIMCLDGREKIKNNSAGLILEISADIIGAVAGGWYFLMLPFACKAGADAESIGFVGFLAVCLFWLISAVFKCISYKSMRRKYRTVNKIYERPALFGSIAILAVVLILGCTALAIGNSKSSFGIYGKEKRELNPDFYAQISNNFNSAVCYNDSIYFFDYDIDHAFCVIDKAGEVTVLNSEYSMVASSPMCLDGSNILFMAEKEGDSAHYVVKYDINTGSFNESVFTDTPEMMLFKTFLGTRGGMLYYITYSQSGNGWYDVRRTTISDNMDLTNGEIYAPHVVYSSELYPAVIGNTGRFSLSAVTAPYSTSQPTVNINGENIYFIDRTPYASSDDGVFRSDLTISNSDGGDQVVLHTFEDIRIVRLYIADTYAVYEYTSPEEGSADYHYGVVDLAQQEA